MPKLKLLLLPFAGGSSYAFAEFASFIDDAIDVVAYDPPGRGTKFGEPLCSDMESMLDDLYNWAKGIITEPYAILGHSMGALLGYLFTHKMQSMGESMPIHLFLSSRRAPFMPSRDPEMHKLDKESFLQRLSHYGNSEDMLKEKELVELFYPVLRSDFTAVETYRFTEMEKLDVETSIFIGDKDIVSFEEAASWSKLLVKKPRLITFEGKHFFILESPKQVAEEVNRHLFAHENRAK